MSKVDVTVLLLTASRVCRADFSGRNASRQLGLVEEPRPVGLSFADALELVLSQQRMLGRKTIILDTSIWSQLVSVPRLSVSNVEPEELQQALKFEVETLVGIEADHAVLGFCEVMPEQLVEGVQSENEKVFWINVAEQENLEYATWRLKPLGARSINMAHPAGFSWQKPDGQQLIELWDNLAVLLDRQRVLAIASRSGHWFGQFGFESLEQAASETKIISESADYLTQQSISAGNVTTLDRPEQLGRWLHRLARRVVRQELADRPMVERTTVPTVRSGQRLLTRVLLAGLFGSFCLLHYYFLTQREVNVDSQQARVERPAELKRNYDDEYLRVLEQHAELESEAAAMQEEVKQIEFLFDFQTGRLESFLEFLMVSRTADLVINEIAYDEKGTRVEGYSLSGESAPDLANKLREKAILLGWRIHAPSQIGEQKMISGGPWKFSLLFEDVGPGQPVVGSPPLKSNVASKDSPDPAGGME